MGILDFFKRERSLEDLAATEHIFMAGWSEGFPAENDRPTPANIDRRHPDFKRGLRLGKKECQRMQLSSPHLFVNGKLRDDSEDD